MLLLMNSYHFVYMYRIYIIYIYIISMVIVDSPLFVIHTMHYIVINRMTVLCMRSLSSVQKIYLHL